jgi:large subunit ribosomal protein L10
VKALAKMPGLPELRARILGMLMQPAGKLVRTIAEPGGRLARVIKARSEQKQ